MAEQLGIQTDKLADPNAWYTEVITKSQLIEYTDVSGCYILRPRAQYMWDTIRTYMDAKLKERNVQNTSFPLFIPEKLLTKEQEHVEGFTPEVAWVTHAGNTPMNERLAVRPTSETIMYPAYAKWIRSHKDLPLKLNQWCNVVRWEFKHPMPFLRSREFYWQEGHTAFATREEAEAEALDILLNVYKDTFEHLLAIPVLAGQKTIREKFAGAVHSLSCECFLPIGKAIQGCTSHYLGENFAKAFEITYLGEDGQTHFAHQNSWGFSTRTLGIAVMMHSDNKGLVLPPRVAQNKVIIIPVFLREGNEETIDFCESLKEMLRNFDAVVDDRTQHTLGFRINDAELSGIPVRIEVGPKEIKAHQVTVVRRDTLTKETIPISELVTHLTVLLDDIHKTLYERAQKVLTSSIVEEYEDKHRIATLVQEGKIVQTAYDGSAETDDLIRELTTGKTLCVPFDKHLTATMCPFTGRPARHVVYIAKSL
jgi:prolyl-tRNA synthetase family I